MYTRGTKGGKLLGKSMEKVQRETGKNPNICFFGRNFIIERDNVFFFVMGFVPLITELFQISAFCLVLEAIFLT